MLSRRDTSTILARCGLLFAAVVLSCALMGGVWDTFLSLRTVARLDASAKVEAILTQMADTGNRAALTDSLSALDGMYDRTSYSGASAYSAEYGRTVTLRKWSGGQSAAVTGAKTTVRVSGARRTSRGYTAVADCTTLYALSGGGIAAVEVSCRREVELRETAPGYIISSDVYLSPPVGKIYKK